MAAPVSDLKDMLTGMRPLLAPDPYKYTKLSAFSLLFLGWAALARGFAFVAEDEGLTQVRKTHKTAKGPLFARITLQVHSDLEAVGLTAAVSSALADAGLACNVIAGLHHDHIFVSWDRRKEALKVLEKLSFDAQDQAPRA